MFNNHFFVLVAATASCCLLLLLPAATNGQDIVTKGGDYILSSRQCDDAACTQNCRDFTVHGMSIQGSCVSLLTGSMELKCHSTSHATMDTWGAAQPQGTQCPQDVPPASSDQLVPLGCTKIAEGSYALRKCVPQDDGDDDQKKTGIIVGAVVGAVGLIAVSVVVFVVIVASRKRQSAGEASTGAVASHPDAHANNSTNVGFYDKNNYGGAPPQQHDDMYGRKDQIQAAQPSVFAGTTNAGPGMVQEPLPHADTVVRCKESEV